MIGNIVLIVFLSLFTLLIVLSSASANNSICDLNYCNCDGYSRVRCQCQNDYQEITIQADGDARILSSATDIEITNCTKVLFMSDALLGLRELKRINIYNSKNLILKENSFYWRFLPDQSEMSVAGLRIGIHNSTMPEIPSHSIKGRIDEILLNNSIIENIGPYAFTSMIGLLKIEIKDCNIKNIATQAFKKFNLNLISIEGSKFRTMPSRMFSEIGVRRGILIKNVTIDKIQSSSFILNEVPRFTIEDCKINMIEGDAFRTTTTGPIVLRNNIIHTMNLGAFVGFSLGTSPTVYGPIDFTLENITLVTLATGSLQVDLKNYNLVIKNLKVNQLCGCLKNRKEGLTQFEMNIFCVVEGSYDPNRIVYKSFSLYQEENCTNTQLSTAIILMITMAVIVAIVMILFLLYYTIRKSKNGFAWITGKKAQNNTSDKEFPVILPDGRTYRETELHVVIERAQLLTTNL